MIATGCGVNTQREYFYMLAMENQKQIFNTVLQKMKQV